ncbi:YjcZ family sporulation protein [Bacillus dakarensis]|uniref:YjcZ family sporulation protein n=1 Tax=Robertmurraya dakarensis TaxID=1926278 RepID=UPI000980C1DF|nr:YjcZ family sporulation protein [Bacillus dakarensis]
MHYGHGYNHCGFDPCYGYGYPTQGYVGGYRGGFVLIVVLFILLIIIGASYCK